MVAAVDGVAAVLPALQGEHLIAAEAEAAEEVAPPLLRDAAGRSRSGYAQHHGRAPFAFAYRAASSSAAEKKKAVSRAAFSAESLPWIALRSIEPP